MVTLRRARGEEETRRTAEPSRKARAVRLFLFPEVGRSWQPLRESGGSFVELWRLFRESVRKGRSRSGNERRKIDTMGFWLLLVGVLCVVYAGWLLAVEVFALLIPEARAQVLDGSMFAGSDPKTRELLDFLYEMGTGEAQRLAK